MLILKHSSFYTCFQVVLRLCQTQFNTEGQLLMLEHTDILPVILLVVPPKKSIEKH